MRKFLVAASLACICLAACRISTPASPVDAASVAAVPKDHDFARWEKDVAAFEAADRLAPPPQNALLFVGSSTVVRWKTLQQDFSNVPIVNRGFGGNQIVDSTHFADRMIFPYRPRMIFLRAGGNDLWQGKSPEEVFADFKDFVGAVRAKLPTAEILYISLSPSVARWKQVDKERAANALIENYIRKNKNLKYIDTFDIPLGADGKPRPELFVADGLHFNDAGYKLLAERIRPFIPRR